MILMKQESSSPTSNTSSTQNDDDYVYVEKCKNASGVITMKLYQRCDIGLNDVLCGRDKLAFNNIGNKRFRIQVSLSLERYLDAPTRKAKSKVIKSVVIIIKQSGGRFLQQVNVAISSKSKLDTINNRQEHDEQIYYVELNEKQSHEKAGHALRDMALARHNHQCQISTCTIAKIKTKKSRKPRINIDMKNVAKENYCDDDNSVSLLSAEEQHELNLINLLLPKDLNQLHVDLHEYYKYDDNHVNIYSSNPTVVANDQDDESIFNQLVQLVADGGSTTTSPNDMIVSTIDSTTLCTVQEEKGKILPVPLQATTTLMDWNQSSVLTTKGFDSLVASNETNNNISNHMRVNQQQEPFSNVDSFATTIDDRVVSWLIGESDSIMNLFAEV